MSVYLYTREEPRRNRRP